jgi:hypothetical protein
VQGAATSLPMKLRPDRTDPDRASDFEWRRLLI